MSEQSRRGLGPFSGTQLTVIIVVFALVLLVPVGAWAATGSKVNVTDPVHGNNGARVTFNGQLFITRSGAKTLYRHSSSANTLAYKPIATAGSQAIFVTSIAFDVYKANATGLGENFPMFMSKNDATCNTLDTGTGKEVADINPGGIGVVTLPFDPGIVIPAGRSLCVSNGDTTNLSAETYVYGYKIPASAAPSGASGTGSGPVTNPQH